MPEFGAPSLSPQAAIQRSQKKTGQEIFEMYLKKDNRIRMTDFYDVYSEQEIGEDIRSLEKDLIAEDYDSSDVQGKVLENLIVDIGEKNMWFGDGENYLIQLSEYDDKALRGAHADAVLEVRLENGDILRLGIDFTLAANQSKLDKKRKKCVDLIENGRLATAKYFQSELNDQKGRMPGIPIVMAGMSRENLHQLCEDVGKKDDLPLHPAQFILLDEILKQLDTLVAISGDAHGFENRLTKELEKYQNIFVEILRKKESLRPDGFREKALEDCVYSYIMN